MFSKDGKTKDIKHHASATLFGTTASLSSGTTRGCT